MISAYVSTWCHDVSPKPYLAPLPLRLKAGLDLMAGSTKLKNVAFWGRKEAVHMKELEWMVQHWK